MVTAAGEPDPRWFGADALHLNEQGYRHWAEVVRPVVTRLHAEATR